MCDLYKPIAVVAPSVRLASLLASTKDSSGYSAAAALAGQQVNWLQRKSAGRTAPSNLSLVLELRDFAVVIAGHKRVATVFVPPNVMRDSIAAGLREKPPSDETHVYAAMRELLDRCGTKPGRSWSAGGSEGDLRNWTLKCAASLLIMLPPAEAVRIGDELEQCRKLGFGCYIVGLLGKDTSKNSSTNASSSSNSSGLLWPLFVPLATAPQHVGQRLIDRATVAPPRIHAAGGGAGAVPALHADRVVGEMLWWIVAERQQRMAALKGILGSVPDADPEQQLGLVDEFKRIGGPFFPLVTLMESRKRGRYTIRILSIEGWNRDIQDLILSSDKIPERPQLAASIFTAKGLGHHQYSSESKTLLIVSHHALSRLVQRSANRSVDDLLTAVTSLLIAYVTTTAAGFKLDEEGGKNSRLRFWTSGGDVIAQLERHRDGSGMVIAKTILEMDQCDGEA
jgi:hypothetical protein